MPKNYYIILGIPSDSSQRDIKAAYRRLAKEFHPDLYGERNSPFLMIQEAYSVLSDPVRRKVYDDKLDENRRNRSSDGRTAEPVSGFHRNEAEPLIPGQKPADPGNPSFDALFDRIVGNFAGERSKGTRLGNPTVEIFISSHQAARGGHVRLLIPARLPCPHCEGRGGDGFHVCGTCNGQGHSIREHPVLIRYPSGISDNHTMQLSLDRYGMRDLYMTVRFRIRRYP